ncbi:hypothetical protein [Candidatus Frankia nodulisporulans]|uniref:hypothetical protein n=1 Tax=Candidatus Frankia nodulisporulans TaxID=2060052 RepID=UPI0013D3BFFF|nr:hypothetical protein [Candidatus Frankia nodulisporulans]
MARDDNVPEQAGHILDHWPTQNGDTSTPVPGAVVDALTAALDTALHDCAANYWDPDGGIHTWYIAHDGRIVGYYTPPGDISSVTSIRWHATVTVVP